MNIKNVVCRDQIIEEYWQLLQKKGISLFAERRFGKSSVIRKMAAEPASNFITIYKSTQGIKSVEDFVEALLSEAKEKALINKLNLDSLTAGWNTFSDIIPSAAGFKLGKINYAWQQQLISLIENISKSNKDKTLVLFLDEFSLMLDAMLNSDAANLIGFLRDLVHDHFPDKLRFVYTGSISIDLILVKLKNAGHNLGDPLNHTERERLQPFDDIQTTYFCKCLELGCGLQLDDELRTMIYFLTDGIPYFIDRIMDHLRPTQEVTKEAIEQAMDFIINDPDDATNLGYYYDRIKDHYPDPALSYLIMVALSKENDLTEAELIDLISNQIEKAPRVIQDEIQRLWKDGYLHRNNKDGDRKYTFLYSVIKQWWIANKA